MSCSGCSSGGSCGSSGCGKSGGCASGGCNRLNTFDWLAALDIHDPYESELVEVSFKNGSTKSFYTNPPHTRATSGDWVVVDTGNGFDVGRISLSGDLVNLQLKKKNIKKDTVFNNVLRKANERDLQRMQEAREKEPEIMVKSRVISRSLKLEMKVCDVELQADHRKATFLYTADGRVDFRELIKHFASEFKVKVEMRQIGARQEAARIGGIGSCGRELCCSTWLSDFKSVSTTAARYQNLAINQSKLSGQCGRLKCCLNYELDVYLDALEDFPEKADKIQTQAGPAILVKTDVFKKIMFYVNEREQGRGKFYPLAVVQVKEIIAGMKAGKLVESLDEVQIATIVNEDEVEKDYEDVTGFVELPAEKRKKKKKKKPRDSREQSTPKDKPTSTTNAPEQRRQDTPRVNTRQENTRQDNTLQDNTNDTGTVSGNDHTNRGNNQNANRPNNPKHRQGRKFHGKPGNRPPRDKPEQGDKKE